MPKLFGGTIHTALVHAVTEYDRRQATRQGYNIYALGHYLRRIEDVEIDVAQGASIRAALLAGFSGPLLNHVLKAVGEPAATTDEKNGRVMYKPASQP